MNWRRLVWPLYRWYLQRSKLPIIVGPFKSEVGFEAMYFQPFLAKLGLSKDRLHVLTRGGAGCWYPHAATLDLYALRKPQEVRIENHLQTMKHKMVKQIRVTAFDRAVISDAAAKWGLKKYRVLHPAWMYETLAPFWNGQRGLEWLKDRLRVEQMPVPDLPTGLTLPPNFVAVRFYLRHTFPYHSECVQFATECVKTLAAQGPVVLLNSGVHADEHVDLPFKGIPNVYRLHEMTELTPTNNLTVQSAVLARAQGFVGTYGGVSQLALRYGKPSVSFFHEWSGTAIAHKHLADAIALEIKRPYLVFKLTEPMLVQAVCPQTAFSLDVVSPSPTVNVSPLAPAAGEPESTGVRSERVETPAAG